MLVLEGLHGNDSEQRRFGFILSSLSRTEKTHVKTLMDKIRLNNT